MPSGDASAWLLRRACWKRKSCSSLLRSVISIRNPCHTVLPSGSRIGVAWPSIQLILFPGKLTRYVSRHTVSSRADRSTEARKRSASSG